MPRAERRRPARSEARWSAWWLAVPVLGIAAYAAFSATLALLGEDPSRAPVGAVREEAPVRAPLAGAPVAAPAAVDVEDAAAVPAEAPSAAAPAPAAVDAAPPSEPTDAPSVTATPATRRAAADEVRKVKPKPVPREHLTEQDHRALDAIIEQAGKNAR